MAKTGLRPTDELVRRAIIGDGTAFTALWDNNIKALRCFLRAEMHVSDDFLTDDICSKSFEKAFRQIGSFDPSLSQFSTWLKAIARNTALDILEQEKRSQRSLVSLDDTKSSLDVLENMGDDTLDPLDDIIKSESQDKTMAYIEGLPELYRDIAHRRLIEEMSYKDIAEETGLPLNTVRTRIRRAKALIDEMKQFSDGGDI